MGGFKMIISTMENVPGSSVKEILGVVRGNTIRARHVGRFKDNCWRRN